MIREKRLNRATLRAFPLPSTDGADDKNSRGTVFAVMGSLRVPGAAYLTGVAALRAGAGKVQIAAPSSIAPTLGLSFLEAGVIPVRETPMGDGVFRKSAPISDALKSATCTVVGPGLMDIKQAAAFARACLAASPKTPCVIDALAISKRVLEGAKRLSRRAVVITPRHGEMAALLDIDKNEVAKRPLQYAKTVATDYGCLVVLKSEITYVVTPSGDTWRHDGGTVGLATSGSGDVLAGILAGLMSRGASPVTAALWAVFLHGRAGALLDKRIGRVGFLARELLNEIPGLLPRGSGMRA